MLFLVQFWGLLMRIKTYKSKVNAFTLIELLLVIVIVSFITVYAVRMINASLLKAKAQKTVSEMVTIKNAILAYYSVNNRWPSSNLLNDLSPIFLPRTSLCSSYPATSFFRFCGFKTPYKGQFISGSVINPRAEWGYFELSLSLPSFDEARAVVQQLPSSWLSSDKKTVYMSISNPGIINNTSGWIVSGGVASVAHYNATNYINYSDGVPSCVFTTEGASPTCLGSQIQLPNCPSGFEGHIFLSPFYYNIYTYYKDNVFTHQMSYLERNIHMTMARPTVTANQHGLSNPLGNVHDISSISGSALDSIVSYWAYNGSQNPYPCNTNSTNSCYMSINSQRPYLPFSIGSELDANNIPTTMVVTASDIESEQTFNLNQPDDNPPTSYHLAYFMTYCVRNGYYATNYIDPMWAQDGQCTVSWQNYNKQARTPCNIVSTQGNYYTNFNPSNAINNIPSQVLQMNPGWDNQGQTNDGSATVPLDQLLKAVGKSSVN